MVVIEKIAGIESIAKIISELSINTKINNNGVACKTPFLRTKKHSPYKSSVTGIIFFIIFNTLLSEKSTASSLLNSIFKPLQNKKNPKIYSIQWNVFTIATPKKININLKTIAPNIPYVRTLFWYEIGILKDVKTSKNRNKLSTLKLNSIMYPPRNSNPGSEPKII